MSTFLNYFINFFGDEPQLTMKKKRKRKMPNSENKKTTASQLSGGTPFRLGTHLFQRNVPVMLSEPSTNFMVRGEYETSTGLVFSAFSFTFEPSTFEPFNLFDEPCDQGNPVANPISITVIILISKNKRDIPLVCPKTQNS